MKKLKLVFAGLTVVVLFGLIALWYGVYGRSKGQVSVVNGALEPISTVSVQICGQVIALQDIGPSGSAAGGYKANCEGHYVVDVQFQSGRKLHSEIGYVTGGFDFSHQIEVSSSAITLKDTQIQGHLNSGVNK
jgi:hypothetical protein